MDSLKYLRDIIVRGNPINIVAFIGVLLTFFSFFRFDGITNFPQMGAPNWMMLIIGIVMWVIALVLYLFFNLLPRKSVRKVNDKIKNQGLKLRLGRTIVNLKIGKIQDRSGLDRDTAVVLPVNTSFVDDCISDKKSATGAYIMEFYSDKVSDLPRIMMEQLEKFGYKPQGNGNYEPGTTILLPPPYDSPAKVLMTASTLRKEKVGIRAEPSTISECIRNVFEITSDKKISRIRMPVLGSGHGGLNVNDALLLLLLTIKYYSEGMYHHIEQIDILILDENMDELRSDYLQLFLSLEEEGK